MKGRAAPSSIEEFQLRLQEVQPELPKRMRQCADYVALNIDRIALATVAELASEAGVQPSAMMRFCQIMGFGGFSEMQRLFRTARAPGLPDYRTRLENLRDQGAGTPSALLAEFVDAGRVSLENLASSIDTNQLDEAVAQLADARLIHVMGLRRAFPVACYLSYAFEKMQIASMLHEGAGKLNHRYAMREGDALVAVSFAPYTQDTVDLAMDAKSRGVSVVAMTDAFSSPLNVPGATSLCVPEVDFGAFRALSGNLSMALTLAVGVGVRRHGTKAVPQVATA